MKFHEPIQGFHMSYPRRALSIVVAILVAGSSALQAQADKEPFSIGVFFGPSVPSDGVSDVYQALDTFGLGGAYRHASTLGLHFGGRVRLGLANGVSFSAGASLCRFAGQDQTVELASGQTETLQTATTLLPVSAGVTLFALQGLVAPYLAAEATYTYRSVSVSTGNSILEGLILNSTDMELEPTTSRIGAAAGAGVQFDIGGLRPFVEFKYYWTNLLGAPADEQRMSFLNVSLGLLF